MTKATDETADQGERGGAAGTKPASKGRLRSLVVFVVAFVLGAAVWQVAAARYGHLLRDTPLAALLPASPAGSAGGAARGEAAAAEQWYTCGMHPNVLEKKPGICPICQMDLTPVKNDEADDEQTGGPEERKVLYWRAPMDPNYVSDKPGKSPMGMDLVPVYADAQSSGSEVRIDPATVQNMGVRTTIVGKGPLAKTVRTLGRIDYDERRVHFVDTKFGGWIEDLHVDETGQQVSEGQVLFEVYSPELYSAQEEYLAALKNLPRLAGSSFEPARNEAKWLLEAAEKKLRYLDVSAAQIEALGKAKAPGKTLSIHSPATGVVTEKMALRGMHVKPGMRLYTIADLSRVWVYVDVYEYQLPWVRVGQQATMSLPYVPGETFVGKVVYIYPYLEERTRVVTVRLEFDNANSVLKPGMYATVNLRADLGRDVVLLPREAYIDSGTRKVAFVERGEGKYAPREIGTGVEAEEGMVEVLWGIDVGESVVVSGQFMIDAESKLKEAMQKMLDMEKAKAGAAGVKEGHGAHTASMEHERGQAAGAEAGIPADAAFACPMDTHPDEEDPAQRGAYFSAQSGRCPWCNMKLVPLAELDWVKVLRAAEGGEVAYTCLKHPHVVGAANDECTRCGKLLRAFKKLYTCPDPTHAGVVRKEPGTCPRCKANLVGFRGVWLEPELAGFNAPPKAQAAKQQAEQAAFRCTVHPQVHSEHEADCTVCAQPLAQTAGDERSPAAAAIPPGSKYTCPMQECQSFSEQPAECAACGMDLVPLKEAEWLQEQVVPPASTAAYLCPMHPETETAAAPGACATCGMQLMARSDYEQASATTEQVALQVGYVTEHYLSLVRLLAADNIDGVAQQALAIAGAADGIVSRLAAGEVNMPAQVEPLAIRVRAAALRMQGKALDDDRVVLVDLSAAVIKLLAHVRPSQARWPKLYVFHCTMSKGSWIQATDNLTNPYYGFKMLGCGELVETR